MDKSKKSIVKRRAPSKKKNAPITAKQVQSYLDNVEMTTEEAKEFQEKFDKAVKESSVRKQKRLAREEKKRQKAWEKFEERAEKCIICDGPVAYTERTPVRCTHNFHFLCAFEKSGRVVEKKSGTFSVIDCPKRGCGKSSHDKIKVEKMELEIEVEESDCEETQIPWIEKKKEKEFHDPSSSPEFNYAPPPTSPNYSPTSYSPNSMV